MNITEEILRDWNACFEGWNCFVQELGQDSIVVTDLLKKLMYKKNIKKIQEIYESDAFEWGVWLINRSFKNSKQVSKMLDYTIQIILEISNNHYLANILSLSKLKLLSMDMVLKYLLDPLYIPSCKNKSETYCSASLAYYLTITKQIGISSVFKFSTSSLLDTYIRYVYTAYEKKYNGIKEIMPEGYEKKISDFKKKIMRYGIKLLSKEEHRK